MNNQSLRESMQLLEEFFINEAPSVWRIRPGLKNAFDRVKKTGDLGDIKKQAGEFIERLKKNKGSNVVDLRLKDNSIVSVDLSKPIDDLVDIDLTASNALEAIRLVTKDENNPFVPIIQFEKEGQFSKPKSPESILSSGQFNGYLAEWAAAWCINTPPGSNQEEIEKYFDDTVSKDPRLSPYLSQNGGFLNDKARITASENFIDMVKNSYDAFESAGIPTGTRLDITPDYRNPTAPVDIKFTHDEVNYTVHIKFDEKKRIAGIQAIKESNSLPEDGATEVPSGEPMTAVDIKTALGGKSVKDIAKDNDSRKKFLASISDVTLNSMASQIKKIVFGNELADGDPENDKPAFNCIVNYSKKNVPSVTVLSSPGVPDKSQPIDPSKVTFTVRKDDDGNTVYFFAVDANISGKNISNAMKVELRDDRVPQLHMSSGWKAFTSALQSKNESMSEMGQLLNEFFAEAKTNSHPSAYKAPQGSKRDQQLDQTQADLKSGDPERIQRAYKRRERMEKQARSKPGWKNQPRKDTQAESIDLQEAMQVLLEALSKKLKATLRKKAEKRGLTPGSVESEYKKGLAAYASSGSRPGMSAHQWAMARVNSANPSKKWATVKKSKSKKKK